MERWHRKVAVVTGASSGIGAAVVKDFVKAGLITVGLARRLDRMEAIRQQLPAEKRQLLIVQKCDVSNVKSVNETFDWILKQLGGIDVLVNNAAILEAGNLCDMSVQVVQDVLQTNIVGVVACTKRAFLSMQQRAVPGHVFLINSIAGHNVFEGFPHDKDTCNIYSPTKYAVTCMTEMYRREFWKLGTKIKVTSVSPGLVSTEIMPDHVKKALGERVLQPEDISQGILYALSTPPHVQVHDLIIKPLGEEIP